MADSSSRIEGAKDLLHKKDDSDMRRTALVTGSVALGAIITSTLFRKIKHLELRPPQLLRPALEAEVAEMEVMEGAVRFYHRDGSGIPFVLLHSINAAGSSYEMKPIFDYLVQNTNRPVFALDWLGFGRSDRPAVRYSPEVYERHLRRFLSEHVHQPADIIALSLACEYTAAVAAALPYLVNRVVLISPTGLSPDEGTTRWQKALIAASERVGAFEIFFTRLTQPDILRDFYKDQIFASGQVPDDLVEYAHATTLIRGAHHAPRYFIQGELKRGREAARLYADLSVPVLLLAPKQDDGLVQHFDDLEYLESHDSSRLRIVRTDSGLMPHWEQPEVLLEEIRTFLLLDEPRPAA